MWLKSGTTRTCPCRVNRFSNRLTTKTKTMIAQAASTRLRAMTLELMRRASFSRGFMSENDRGRDTVFFCRGDAGPFRLRPLSEAVLRRGVLFLGSIVSFGSVRSARATGLRQELRRFSGSLPQFGVNILYFFGYAVPELRVHRGCDRRDTGDRARQPSDQSVVLRTGR